jgi:uncharacterized protein YkvS
MKKIIVSLLLSIVFYFPVFSQQFGIPLQRYTFDGNLESFEKNLSLNAKKMFDELKLEYIDNINSFEVVPVSSLVRFTNYLSGKSFYYVSKVQHNSNITKNEVVDNTTDLDYTKKKLSVVYLKNEESNYDKLLFYIVYY